MLQLVPQAVAQDTGPFTFPGARIDGVGDITQFIVKAAPVQTNNLIEIQDNAGAAFVTVTAVGNTIFDVTSTEAVLVRKNADGGDVFAVDTTTPKVIIDANLEFTGEQTITTTAGDLILDAADDVFLSPSDEVITDRDFHSYGGARYRQYSGSGTGLRTLLGDGVGYIFNEAGEAGLDFRVESDSNQRMLFLDSGANSIGVGISGVSYTPSGQIEVVNAASITQMLGTCFSVTTTHQARFELRRSHHGTEGTLSTTQDGDYLGAFIVNGVNTGNNFDDDAGRFQFIQDGAAGAVRIPTQLQFMLSSTAVSNQNVLTLRASSRVGIMEVNPTAQLHIDQPSATGAVPVLTLDQGDIDDTFINYLGTSAADGSRSISSDTTEDSAKFGAIRVEINNVTKWIRIYDDES